MRGCLVGRHPDARSNRPVRERGSVLIPWTYLPWEKVRVVRWRPVRSGRELVLRSGWRWMAAKVPEDSVDAVEYLLRAKMKHVG